MGRAAFGTAVYVALLGSVFTGLYDPLTEGRDDSWAILVVVAAAHVGVGVAVARAWVLSLPVLFCIGVFLAQGEEGLAWLILMFGLLPLCVLTGVGWAIGRTGAWALAAGIALVAAGAPLVWAGRETVKRSTAEHVDAATQRRLPTDESLGNLCPGAETPKRVVRKLRRAGDLLVREARRRPDALVTYTYYYSDEPTERKDISLRELAREQLNDLGSGGSPCAPDLARRLKAVAE